MASIDKRAEAMRLYADGLAPRDIGHRMGLERGEVIELLTGKKFKDTAAVKRVERQKKLKIRRDKITSMWKAGKSITAIVKDTNISYEYCRAVILTLDPRAQFRRMSKHPDVPVAKLLEALNSHQTMELAARFLKIPDYSLSKQVKRSQLKRVWVRDAK